MQNGGIEQVRLFVLACRVEDVNRARDYFRSIEANLIANFKSMGSVLIPLLFIVFSKRKTACP